MKQRDLLLIPFPFSDQSGKKVRPVMVLSKDLFNNSSEDLIVCAVTSNISNKFYSIKISNEHLETGKLYEESLVKTESILKIDKKLVIKKIGKLSAHKFGDVLDMFYTLFK